MRFHLFGNRVIGAALCALFVAGCRAGGGVPSQSFVPAYAPNARAPQPMVKGIDKIQHVVIIVQENRSFNNLFYGYPGAKTSKYGKISTGKQILIQPVSLSTKWDLEHNSGGFIRSCNGIGKIPGTNCRMNGFDKQTWGCDQPGKPKCPIKYPPYAYVPHDQITPYFDMAGQYVLADQFYASDFDTSSYISHQYIIAGINPGSAANYPETVWGCPGGTPDRIDRLGPNREITLFPKNEHPCSDVTTLADELDAARVSWRFYAAPVSLDKGQTACGSSDLGPDASKGRRGIWSAYQAIRHICYGPDWSKDVFSPPTRFFNDLSRGRFQDVTWITPTYGNSDHGGNGSATGPSWVASLVNAIGKSPYWNSTAIFIFWDDSGGWYDSQPPAYLDDDGLGFRLPLLIISPYAKKGLVTHEHFEHGSILRFIENRFGLAQLAASDQRAKSPQLCCFDFSKPPRKFVPFKAPFDQSYFMAQPLDMQPPDSD
ncbi:MAG TPA: alkaline phosphatase family protein [Candidatus Cybelea sp.]|jgi:phospholipase C|nr:alkaline phosphatase family protein [Candidatus Cybelea sp.]